MEPISTFLITALGYILKGAAQSKTADSAKEELLERFWQWIRPKFIKELPQTEEKADEPETETQAQAKLMELIKDKAFFQELVKQVSELQNAGIKEKNIVRNDIQHIKKIRIGDRQYSPDETFDRKNIVDGSIEDADEFILGDGH